MQDQQPYIITSSFIVNGSDLNTHAALNICKILSITNQHNDQAIRELLGVLDFSRIDIAHYYLDFIGRASLYDLVVFQSYAYLHDDNLLEITLNAYKKKGRMETSIVNGCFVFDVKGTVPISYSLS